MADYPVALDKMLAAWNEPDSSLVRRHLAEALSSSIRFVDPSIDLTGIADFEANVHKVRAGVSGVSSVFWPGARNVGTHPCPQAFLCVFLPAGSHYTPRERFQFLGQSGLTCKPKS